MSTPFKPADDRNAFHNSSVWDNNLVDIVATTLFRKGVLKQLTSAGQYDHNVMLSMMNIFLFAGGTGNKDFRFSLRVAQHQKLEIGSASLLLA